MHRQWVSNLEDEDLIKEFEQSMRTESTKRVLTRLDELLTKKTSSAHKSQLNKDGYESPSWAYRQADLIGYERAMQEVRELIK